MAAPPAPERFDLQRLIRELSSSVGEEMAQKVVAKVATELGAHPDRPLAEAMRDKLLKRLAEEPGLVGLAAGVLGHRLRLESSAHPVPSEVAPRPAPVAVPPSPPSPNVEKSLIVAHMAATVGVEKAEELVAIAMRLLAIPAKEVLTRDECEQIVDSIADHPGLVGLAARVTKQKIRMGMLPLKPLG